MRLDFSLWDTRDGSLSAFGLRVLLAVALALLISMYGLAKKSLSRSGAAAAAVVGTLTFLSGPRFGLTLILFFLSSSRLTKMNAARKRAIDSEYREGGQRTWVQVLSNSIVATGICLYHFVHFGDAEVFDYARRPLATSLEAAFLGYYCCCNGDTWASEVGPIDPRLPRLVTTCRRVPHGTNGALSVAGTLASALGGATLGVAYWLMIALEPLAPGVPPQWPAALLGTAAGFAGSLIDSLLGATLQYSGLDESRRVVNHPVKGAKHIAGWDVLTNNQVNLISATLTAALCFYVARFIF